MSSRSSRKTGPMPNSAEPRSNKKGSVKRAREQLEAGKRPNQASPPVPAQFPARTDSHQTQWPLPASGLQPCPPVPNQHPRFVVPRGPPPARPRRPSQDPQIPPSNYSARNAQRTEARVNYFNRPVRSFSHPKPPQQPLPRPPINDGPCASSTSTVGTTPRISVTTDELFRRSNASASSSTPGVPPVPSRATPQLLEIPRHPTPALIAPRNVQDPRSRGSSASPANVSGSPSNSRQTLGSLASSGAVPSSWGSGPAESEIFGAYLDLDSDSDENDHHGGHNDDSTLVRHASIGKRAKPTMRTISKHNTASEGSSADRLSSNLNENPKEDVAAVGVAVSSVPEESNPERKGSASTMSNESCIDPARPRFAQLNDAVYNPTPEKDALPRAAPAMSDKRPGARIPPRLDINAVRDAEARGSLSSLTDLLRRATKLASNLDRGKTASCADFAAEEDFKGVPGYRGRTGSLSDMLASFPNPSLTAQNNRGSWPAFLSLSNQRNAQPLKSNDDGPDARHSQRRCCGMPRKWFILLCILLFIIVALAVLLPVFLVAVPQQNASQNSCSQTTPCRNGGVSVSSGTDCSCVCSNGFTGSDCTIAGDSSCVTSEVDNGTISKKATMGSSIPHLFAVSQPQFGIALDSVTIMALFSKSNVSCQTENALVTFNNAFQSSSNSRRSIELPLDTDRGDGESDDAPSQTLNSIVTGVALAARSTATSNGIVYDNTLGSPTQSTSTDTATQTSSAETKPAPSANTTTTTLPDAVLEFSQVAVLYILQTTGSLDSALYSESQIRVFLTDPYGKAPHPRLELLGQFGLDFENQTISVHR